MQKASRIVLLAIAFLAISAATNNCKAQDLTNVDLQTVNLSSSKFVSKTNKKAPSAKPKIEAKVSAPTYTFTFPPKALAANVPTQPEATSTPVPTVTPPTASSNLDANKIFDMVNAYRASQGLGPFEKANDEVQQLAQVRSTELIGEGANGTIHSGLYNRNLPYWIWENAKYGSDEAGTVAWWINSSLHRRSILGDYKYSAVACTGNYCVQLFTSFVAK